MPMVNGMLACIITASISSVNYEGKVLPDLLSLGSTSELQVSPAVSTGSVYDVSIYGMSNINLVVFHTPMVPSRLLTCSDLKLFLNKTILDMIYI